MALGGIDLLQLTTIAFTILFWLPFRFGSVERMTIGMVSTVGWFATMALTMLEYELGWTWSAFYAMLGVITGLSTIWMMLKAWMRAGRRF